MSGERLDLTSGAEFSASSSGGSKQKTLRFLGIKFACCGVYSRIYINRSETAYEGCCPKCGKRVDVKIGSGGTDKRFFTAY